MRAYEDEQMIRIMRGESPLPEWAERETTDGEICPMVQAYTKDGSKHGNAVVTEITIKHGEVRITLVTEAGNIIYNMNMSEFEEAFTPGKWVMRRFPTTESRKAWEHRHVS